MVKRCLFGGSFDPVHQGHLEIAERARAVCGLDEVVFLPCACSPLKAASPVAEDGQRLEMLSLALADLPWAVVDHADLVLPPPSWSWRVAELFKSRYPEDSLFWLMGVDQWNDLERWGRWEYLSELVTFIVHHRGEAIQPRPAINAIFVEGHHPASSSEIRALLKQGGQIPEEWLNPEVLGFIERNELYR